MVDSYPLYLDLGQIHCISLYPPEPSTSCRRCKVQRTKDKGQYTLTQSPLQRGRVPRPGRDTSPPREGKTVAFQPATTCTEPRHASGSGCPPLAREGKTNCRPASNYMHRAKTCVWLRLRPLFKVDLVRGALAVGVTLPLLKVWRPTRVLHLLLDMQCRRCWDAGQLSRSRRRSS